MNMITKFSSLKFSLLMACTLLAFSPGCFSSSDSDGDAEVDVSGNWSGTGNYNHNNVPVTQFNLNLSQDGNNVSGNYSIKRDARPTMNGTISGSVSGNSISMTMTPHGMADGSVNGNTMNLTWFESGFGGEDFTGDQSASVQISR